MTADALGSRLEEFKSDLTRMTPLQIVRKHVVFGDCAAMSQQDYFQLRQAVSAKFDLHPNNVLVVGSGKLGFSIAPNKRYKLFGDRSDLDVVIVSDTLFDSVWRDLYRYSSTVGYWEREDEFRKFLFRGWIRPDKLPPDQHFEFSKLWWEFFNDLSASREYSASRVVGAIYRSWDFLESYQTIAINGCVRALPRRIGE